MSVLAIANMLLVALGLLVLPVYAGLGGALLVSVVCSVLGRWRRVAPAAAVSMCLAVGGAIPVGVWISTVLGDLSTLAFMVTVMVWTVSFAGVLFVFAYTAGVIFDGIRATRKG